MIEKDDEIIVLNTSMKKLFRGTVTKVHEVRVCALISNERITMKTKGKAKESGTTKNSSYIFLRGYPHIIFKYNPKLWMSVCSYFNRYINLEDYESDYKIENYLREKLEEL